MLSEDHLRHPCRLNLGEENQLFHCLVPEMDHRICPTHLQQEGGYQVHFIHIELCHPESEKDRYISSTHIWQQGDNRIRFIHLDLEKYEEYQQNWIGRL